MTLAAGVDELEAFARVRLIRSPHVGPVAFAQLLARFGTAAAALDALPELAVRGGGRRLVAPEREIEREMAAVVAAGARYLFLGEAGYPRLLALCEGAPPVLVTKGTAPAAGAPCLAIVGARNASAGSARLARALAAELSGEGVCVVSGLARGIDGAAHQGALAGKGGTIGVIATGIDLAYPPENAALHEAVAARGLLLTEHAPGTGPLARHFPARNRIIAGIAHATLVVEAAPQSGSLITARLAGELGREVMAVPGSPLDPRSRGCNGLIREGATLVESAADVLELLRGFDGGVRAMVGEAEARFEAAPVDFEEPAPSLAERLGTAPVAVDELVRQSGASAGAVAMALLELELAGRLERHAGGRVSLA